MSTNKQQTILEQFSGLLSSGKMASTRRTLNNLHPTEIARLIESLPIQKRRILWGLLHPENAGEVLLEVSDDVRDDLIDVTDADELIRALKDLETDELADLFSNLPQTVTDGILQQLADQDRQRLEQVISYAEDSAGGLMDIDTISIRENISLDIVRRYLRMRQNLPEHTDSLFVVDHKNHYLGILSLSNLLTKSRSTLVREVMNTEIRGIDVNTPDTEVANLFQDFDLVSSPVIDVDGTLVGRITVDDVVDVIRKEARQVEFSAAGLPADESLFSATTTSAQRRGVWLGINLITAFLAAWVISLFEGTLEKLIALAILLPVVASMGGIAGTQTLTLIIRGIATGQVGQSNTFLILLKELRIGALNSLVWGLIVGLLAAYWFDNIFLGVMITIAMIVNLISAALAGVYIPVLMKKLGIDPAVAGGVVLTTITDIIGIFTFLGLATLFLL